MGIELKVPEMGESVVEVEVGEWHKAEGDFVEKDEIVVELETDKATLDLPAPTSGSLAKVLKQSGETVSIGDVIGLLEEGDGQAPKGRKGDGAGKAVEAEKAEAKKEKQGEREGKTKREEKAEDRAGREKKGEEGEREQKEERGGGRITPAARRALSEFGLEASQVRATGPGGRLLKEDVIRYVEERDAKEARPAAARRGEEPAGPPAGHPGPVPSGDRQEEVVPMSLMRRRIAARLVEAQQTAALLTTVNEIDMTAVMELRRRHGEAFQDKHGVKLGIMSFFVKAVIEGLKLIPQLNAEVRENDVVYRNYYDIGIAVGGGRGLVVPVLRNAEQLSFAEIEERIGDFARRARDNALKLDELQGGTFSITNGGVYGSLLSTPIINPPQSGVLGMHAIQERPVSRGGEVVLRPMMYVALTYDHRIVDGRESVTFLKHVKELVEEPSRILMEV